MAHGRKKVAISGLPGPAIWRPEAPAESNADRSCLGCRATSKRPLPTTGESWAPGKRRRAAVTPPSATLRL
jgi:hypothetical protein